MRIAFLSILLFVSAAGADTISFVGHPYSNIYFHLYSYPDPPADSVRTWEIGTGHLNATFDTDTGVLSYEGLFEGLGNLANPNAPDFFKGPISIVGEHRYGPNDLFPDGLGNLTSKAPDFDYDISDHNGTAFFHGDYPFSVGITIKEDYSSILYYVFVAREYQNRILENGVTLSLVRAPEPSTLALLSLGLLGWKRGRSPRSTA